MYLEKIRRTHGKKQYVSTLIRESYRDKGKVKHRTIANISKLPAFVIKGIEALFNDADAKFQKLESLDVTNSREFGASNAFMDLAKQLMLDKIIYSRKTAWRQDVLAMMIGRILYQGSKLHLTQLHYDSILWELAGYHGSVCPDVEKHCYESLDRLLERQAAIQKELAKKHLSHGSIILYDITSSYLEGAYEESDLVSFGYSRDCKRRHEQIVIGLLTNEIGCPVAVEVFSGNTSDQTTVLTQAEKLVNDYQIKDVILVGDRGMLTSKRIEEVNHLGYKTLTVLNRPQLRELKQLGVITTDHFSSKEVTEIQDPTNQSVRYFLCKNPEREAESQETRNALIEKTKEVLEKIAANPKGTEQKRCAQIGKVLAKYKVGKFFTWSFKNKKLVYQLEQDKVADDELLDGCYVVRTDSRLTKEEAIRRYKDLAHVERAFRNIKTMSLEIRPVYHQLDRRIKAHVFLCMLAYYIEWHAIRRLQLLFAQDGKGTKKHFSFTRIIERLKSIRIQDCSLNGIQIPKVITTPDVEQQVILDLLKRSQKHEILVSG
jgi:transposase